MRNLLLGLITFSLCLGAWAQDSRPAVAVIDFENRSANGGPELGEMCAEVMSDFLVQSRQFRVFDRSRIDSVIEEQSFQHMSGFVDENEAVRFGRMIGVQYLISGAILRTGVETNEFSGYGVTTRTDVWQARIRAQVIDVESGQTIYSQTGEAEQTIQGTAAHGGTINTMIFEELLEEVIPPITDDLTATLLQDLSRQETQQAASAPEQIDLSIESTPRGGEIEIDGVFYGNAPSEIAVTPGMHTIRVSLAGHEAWERTMQVAPGSRVSATLTPIPSQPGAIMAVQTTTTTVVPTVATHQPSTQQPTFTAQSPTMLSTGTEVDPMTQTVDAATTDPFPSTALRSDSEDDEDEDTDLFTK